MKYSNLLAIINKKYEKILCENLVGIYVHGSIAFGCFSWERSDIDFIVVVDNPISQQIKLQLLQVLIDLSDEAPVKGFEMSVVLKKYCEKFIYPTPYELHFSNDYYEENSRNLSLLCVESLEGDPDLAAHFSIIRSVGVVLCGKPISEVFGTVTNEDYLDSIRKDVENAKEDVVEYPIYVILNLCRVYAYMKEGLILSKEKGGQWGLDNLPSKYHGMITRVLNNYIDGTVYLEDVLLQIEFCEYMLDFISLPNSVLCESLPSL